MDKQTVQWIITAVLRLAAGYCAVKLGENAIAGETWTALGDGIGAAIIIGVSVWTSIRGRKTLLKTKPPKK